VRVRNSLIQTLQLGQHIVDFCRIILEEITTISEVQFALKYKGTELSGVRTVEQVGFSKLDLVWEV